MPRPKTSFNDGHPMNYTAIEPKKEAGSSWAGLSREEFSAWHAANVGRITGAKHIGPLAESKATARQAFVQRTQGHRENAQLVRVMGRMRS